MSVLGEHNKRIKTDVRLNEALASQVQIACQQLGVPKNFFYTFAACDLLVRLSPLLPSQKSNFLQKEIANLLQKIQENLRNNQ